MKQKKGYRRLLDAFVICLVVAACSGQGTNTTKIGDSLIKIDQSMQSIEDSFNRVGPLIDRAVIAGAKTGKLCAQAFHSDTEIDACIKGRLEQAGFIYR